MRLDKYLCELNIGSRSEVKEFIRKGLVSVNGNVTKRPEEKIDECNDIVCYREKQLVYSKFVYYMLNKPAGVVSATSDKQERTVLDIIKPNGRNLFPVGRLDKDTTGLLLITDDGELAHELLSPKKHVDKTYFVEIEHSLTDEDIQKLCAGVDIGDEKPTAPASLKLVSESAILLTIHEGRYHQVKRMLQAVDNRVVSLQRVSFANLRLDENLAPGDFRPLTEQEVILLHEAKNAGGKIRSYI